VLERAWSAKFCTTVHAGRFDQLVKGGKDSPCRRIGSEFVTPIPGTPASARRQTGSTRHLPTASDQAYINSALYAYLDRPPMIQAETPFFEKWIAGKNMWIALIEFYCGESERNKIHCLTVIVYDPLTNEHRFMKPDEVTQEARGDAI
jgi:hypothetical protein